VPQKSENAMHDLSIASPRYSRKRVGSQTATTTAVVPPGNLVEGKHTACSTAVHLSDLASRADQSFSEEELLLKRLGPDAVARSAGPRKPSLQQGPAGPAPGSRRWVRTSAVSQSSGGSGGRQYSLVRRLSSLAGFKLPKSPPSAVCADVAAAAGDNANPTAHDGDGGPDWWLADAGAASGGRRDSWAERLSNSDIAQRLDFLSTCNDSIARAVGRRAGASPRPGDASPETAAPAPRPASVVTRAVRRLSMRRSQ
jgi:hypothetical protein